MTPHQVMFGNSIGSSAGDVEQDFDGDCEGQDIDLDGADNSGYFFGHGRQKPNGVPSKHFKEDDDDFFDHQYREGNESSEK